MPRCSVVIPAYNVEGYVEEAVRSALSQTYASTEVIVVDDGSTDRTAEAIEQFGDRIRLLEQPNRGLAAARNRALEAATGEFIALLDGDDVFLPTRLERMVAYLEAHPEIGFATSDAYLLYGRHASGDTYYRHAGERGGVRFRTENQDRWIVQGNFVLVMTVTRRELFERHGRFEETLETLEDWDLWMRFILGGERVGLVDEPLAHYRLRPGSLSSARVARVRADRVSVLERNLAGVSPGPPGARARLHWCRGMMEVGAARYRVAARHFAAAARAPDQSWRARLRATIGALVPRSAPIMERLSLRVGDPRKAAITRRLRPRG